MNKLIYLMLLMIPVFMVSCDDDDNSNDDQNMTEYDYHAHIHSPNSENKHVDDTIHIHVNFESHAGETIHHINVRIYNKMDSTVVYSKPDDAHIHDMDGDYEFHDDFILSEENGITGHSNWVLEAKVWGHSEGEGEVVEFLSGGGFHVHP